MSAVESQWIREEVGADGTAQVGRDGLAFGQKEVFRHFHLKMYRREA
jgi:hypothetical protein